MEEKRKAGYLFTLELFMEGQSLEAAQQKLIKILEKAGGHYRIKSVAEKGSPSLAKDDTLPSLARMLESYLERGTLLRLHIIKGRGVKYSIPCRILHFDEKSEILSVYHVDEKQVYSFKLNEIEDVVAFE